MSDDSSSNVPEIVMHNKSEEINQLEKTLVLQGILDSSGNLLLRIDHPTLYNRKLSRPTPDQRTGRYFVMVNYNEADSLKVYFDGFVSGDRYEESPSHGFFEIQIPVKNRKIQSVKIIETSTKKLFTEFKNDDIIRK